MENWFEFKIPCSNIYIKMGIIVIEKGKQKCAMLCVLFFRGSLLPSSYLATSGLQTRNADAKSNQTLLPSASGSSKSPLVPFLLTFPR